MEVAMRAFGSGLKGKIHQAIVEHPGINPGELMLLPQFASIERKKIRNALHLLRKQRRVKRGVRRHGQHGYCRWYEWDYPAPEACELEPEHTRIDPTMPWPRDRGWDGMELQRAWQ